MRNKIKTYLFLGAAVASIVPVATVLSCGSQNNSQKDKEQVITPSDTIWTDSTKPAQAIVMTDDFFNNVQNTIEFFTRQADHEQFVYVDSNNVLDQGLPNATLKYGWSNQPGATQPVNWVTDYKIINDMKDQYVFWVLVVPNNGIPMGDGQKTTWSITANTKGIPIPINDNKKPAATVVVTDDLFAAVKNSIKFTLKGLIIFTVDNPALNAGIDNAWIKYGYVKDWDPSGATPPPDGYVFDYHTLKLFPNSVLWIVVTPYDGFNMGQGQQTTLKITVPYL